MAHVGSPLRGRVAEVRVRVGDAVAVGAELVVVESPELGEAQADYLQRRVAVQTTEPTIDLARVAWERAQGLFERSQGISLTEVQRREAEYKAAVAALRAAESARTAAANRLRLLGMDAAAIDTLAATGELVPRYVIRAAIDGVVVQREVTTGELVGPDREYLMVLADTRRLWVLADVPESRLAEIRVGARAFVRAGFSGDDASRRTSGTVTLLSPFVDPTTRTVAVRIEVAREPLALRPGTFVEAEIETGTPEDAAPTPVVVPSAAVVTIDGTTCVFVPVAGAPGAFQRRVVDVGTSVAGRSPVIRGLAEGESFVASGAFLLQAELGKHAAEHGH